MEDTEKREDAEKRLAKIIDMVMEGLLNHREMFCFESTFEFDSKKFRLTLSEECEDITYLKNNN